MNYEHYEFHIHFCGLIFPDDIACLNTTLKHARTGANIIGETLAQKRIKSNYGKSKYVLLGSMEFRKKPEERLPYY